MAQKSELDKSAEKNDRITKKSGNQSINSPKYGLAKRKLVKRSWNRSNIAKTQPLYEKNGLVKTVGRSVIISKMSAGSGRRRYGAI